MELFTKLFSDLLVFVYHCFDRVVIHGLLERTVTPRAGRALLSPGRRRSGGEQRGPGVSEPPITRNWVEAFARNHNIPIEWAEKGVRKEDYVQPWLRKMLRKNAYGVYFIFKSMEQGPSFRAHRAEVSDQGSHSPHLGPPEEPFHPRLLLHPR